MKIIVFSLVITIGLFFSSCNGIIPRCVNHEYTLTGSISTGFTFPAGSYNQLYGMDSLIQQFDSEANVVNEIRQGFSTYSPSYDFSFVFNEESSRPNGYLIITAVGEANWYTTPTSHYATNFNVKQLRIHISDLVPGFDNIVTFPLGQFNFTMHVSISD
jgi:hypothetical protein